MRHKPKIVRPENVVATKLVDINFFSCRHGLCQKNLINIKMIPSTQIIGKYFFFNTNSFEWRRATDKDYRNIIELVPRFSVIKDLDENDPLWYSMWKSYTRGSGKEATLFKELRWFDGETNISKKERRIKDLENNDYLGCAMKVGSKYVIVLKSRNYDILRHEIQHAMDDSDDFDIYGCNCHSNVFDFRNGNIFYHEVRGRIVEKQTKSNESLEQTIQDTWEMYCGEVSSVDIKNLAMLILGNKKTLKRPTLKN